MFLVGRDYKSAHPFFEFAHALAATAVGIHDPYLHGIAIGVEESDTLAILNPYGVALGFGRTCNTLSVGTVDIHYIEIIV